MDHVTAESKTNDNAMQNTSYEHILRNRSLRVFYTPTHLDPGIPEQKIRSSDPPYKILIGRRVRFTQSICEVGHYVAALVAGAFQRSIGYYSCCPSG